MTFSVGTAGALCFLVISGLLGVGGDVLLPFPVACNVRPAIEFISCLLGVDFGVVISLSLPWALLGLDFGVES